MNGEMVAVASSASREMALEKSDGRGLWRSQMVEEGNDRGRSPEVGTPGEKYYNAS